MKPVGARSERHRAVRRLANRRRSAAAPPRRSTRSTTATTPARSPRSAAPGPPAPPRSRSRPRTRHPPRPPPAPPGSAATPSCGCSARCSRGCRRGEAEVPVGPLDRVTERRAEGGAVDVARRRLVRARLHRRHAARPDLLPDARRRAEQVERPALVGDDRVEAVEQAPRLLDASTKTGAGCPSRGSPGSRITRSGASAARADPAPAPAATTARVSASDPRRTVTRTWPRCPRRTSRRSACA